MLWGGKEAGNGDGIEVGGGSDSNPDGDCECDARERYNDLQLTAGTDSLTQAWQRYDEMSEERSEEERDFDD